MFLRELTMFLEMSGTSWRSQIAKWGQPELGNSDLGVSGIDIQGGIGGLAPVK